MPPLLTGDIEETTGLYDALVRVQGVEISCGVLRIASTGFIGLIGISSSDRIIGAVTKDEKASKLTDSDAVDKILSMTQGTFEYYEVPEAELSRLDQKLGMEISEIIAKRAPAAQEAEGNGDHTAVAEEAEAEQATESELPLESEPQHELESGVEAESADEPITQPEPELAEVEAAAEVEAEVEAVAEVETAAEVETEAEVEQQVEAEAPSETVEAEATQTATEKPKVVSALSAEDLAALAAIPDVKTLDAIGQKPESTAIAKSALDDIPTPSTASTPTSSLLAKFKDKKPSAEPAASATGLPDQTAQSEATEPKPFDPTTDELQKNAAATVERIKKFRKPDSEIAAETERAQRNKFASSRRTKDDDVSQEPDADNKLIRPVGNEPTPIAKVKAPPKVVISPKVGIAIGVVGALGITFLATRGAIANYFVNSATAQFDKREYAAALSTLSPAFVFDPSSSKAHFFKGQILNAQGEKAKAFEEYDEALKSSPLDGEILRAHAISAWHLGKFKLLKEDTDALIANDPTAKNDGYLYGLRGKAELALGQYQDAINDCTTALKLGQKTPWIYSRRGWAYTLKGDAKAGLKDFAVALSFPKTDETTPETWVGKAQALQNLGDSKGALAAYEQAFKLNAKVPDYYVRRAWLYNFLKQTDKAWQDYVQALHVDPNYTPAHIGKSDILAAQSKFDDALKELNSVPKKFETADLHFARGRIYMRKNDFKNAVACFKQGLALNSKGTNNYLDLAYSYGGLHNYKDAVAAVQSAIDLQPTNASLRAWHGFYLQCAGQLVQAEKDYEQALSMDPKNPDAHFWRGGLFEGKGDQSAAIQDYEATLASNPNNEDAKKRLAALTKVVRHSSDTRTASVDKITIIPGDFKTLMAQGYAKYKSRDARGAVNCFYSAVSLDPSNMQARKYLAYSLLMKGNRIDAIAQFQAINASGTIDPADYRTLGMLLVETSPGDAIEVFLKILLGNSRDTEARLKLAEAYTRSGDVGKGLDALKEGMKVDPAGTARYNVLIEKLKKGDMQKENGRPEEGNGAG